MIINEGRLFEIISENISALNSELEILNGMGIFFAPELHLSFTIGKEVMKNRVSIFNSNDVFWDREVDLKNGGPSDIVFYQQINNERKIIAVIEFKLRDKIDAYKADIEKLLRIESPDIKKYFCVLLDSFSKSNDARLTKLEENFQQHLVRINQNSFATNQNWYKRQVYCVLSLYVIF